VDAALVASQWQHRALSFAFHPPTNAEHEGGQAARTVFNVFIITRPGIEPNLPTLVAYAQPIILLLLIC